MTNTYPHTDAVYTEAMDKLRDEMATSKSEGVQALGEGMTSWLREHPSEAGALLAEGKTSKGHLPLWRHTPEARSVHPPAWS